MRFREQRPERVCRIPKAGLHNHVSLGGSRHNCSYSCRRTSYHIEPVMGVLSSSAEMET